MRDKIAELADTMYSDLAYDGGPSYAWFEELADAILALEKNGRHWCKWYKDFCMYQLCSRHHDWLSCPDCRLVTIADLTEVK